MSFYAVYNIILAAKGSHFPINDSFYIFSLIV